MDAICAMVGVEPIDAPYGSNPSARAVSMTTRSTFGATPVDDSIRLTRIEVGERADEAFALGSTTIVRHHDTGAESEDRSQDRPAIEKAFPTGRLGRTAASDLHTQGPGPPRTTVSGRRGGHAPADTRGPRWAGIPGMAIRP